LIPKELQEKFTAPKSCLYTPPADLRSTEYAKPQATRLV
jgi:hypothetical protein